MSSQRLFAQGITASAWNVGDVVSSAKIEAAQANNVDGAMSRVHFPELSRRDPVLEQDLDLAIERRHSQLANVLATALNALQNKDNRRHGMLRPRSKQSLDKVQQSVRGAEVFIERLIERLPNWLVGLHQNRLIEPFLALEIMKDQTLYYICPCRNTLSTCCSKTICGELDLGRGQNGWYGHVSVSF